MSGAGGAGRGGKGYGGERMPQIFAEGGGDGLLAVERELAKGEVVLKKGSMLVKSFNRAIE